MRPAAESLLGLSQKMMQRTVLPRCAGLVVQLLEPCDVALRNGLSLSGVTRVAEIDTASERPPLAGRAQAIDLERTPRLVDRRVVGQPLFQQQLGFRTRDEQGMAVFLETATATAELAHRRGSRDVRRQFVVDRQQAFSQRRHK